MSRIFVAIRSVACSYPPFTLVFLGNFSIQWYNSFGINYPKDIFIVSSQNVDTLFKVDELNGDERISLCSFSSYARQCERVGGLRNWVNGENVIVCYDSQGVVLVSYDACIILTSSVIERNF